MESESWEQAEVRPDSVDDDRDVVEQLAEEYVDGQARGEEPPTEEYTARCPDRAEEIRDLFPAIVAIERCKPRPGLPRPRPTAGFVIPERLGDCRLIREIGRGGMGIVYEA